MWFTFFNAVSAVLRSPVEVFSSVVVLSVTWFQPKFDLYKYVLNDFEGNRGHCLFVLFTHGGFNKDDFLPTSIYFSRHSSHISVSIIATKVPFPIIVHQWTWPIITLHIYSPCPFKGPTERLGQTSEMFANGFFFFYQSGVVEWNTFSARPRLAATLLRRFKDGGPKGRTMFPLGKASNTVSVRLFKQKHCWCEQYFNCFQTGTWEYR